MSPLTIRAIDALSRFPRVSGDEPLTLPALEPAW